MLDSEVGKLIEIIGRLPTLGERSAHRIVVHLLKRKHTTMSSLIKVLQNVYDTSVKCEICNNIDVSTPCTICSSTKRDKSIICVVSDIADVWAIERAGFYNGLYHVIGGKLSAVDGTAPKDLDIDGLLKRMEKNNVSEVIIAMSADMDGKTTTFYIQSQIKCKDVKVSIISHGIPSGGEFDYLDNSTIISAFKGRQLLN